MKTLSMLLLMAVTFTAAYSQAPESLTKKEQRQLLKEETRRQRAIQDSIDAVKVIYMLENAKFVLEATSITDQSGYVKPVPSIVNFVLVDSTRGTVQMGSPYMFGSNGVGGATLDGAIRDYSFTKARKRDTYTAHYIQSSALGIFDITITLTNNGYATAYIGGNYAGTIKFSGKMKLLTETSVHKGSPIY